MNKFLAILLTPVFLSCSSSKETSATSNNSETETPQYSFYKAYQNYFPIGTAISPEVDLVSEERKKFIAQQYNSVTAENQMKLKFIHPQKDKWNWEPADKIVAFAKENKMKVRGHALIWQQNVPNWFLLKNNNLISKDELFTNMKSHIEALVNRYKDNVYCWDVVNEAISDNKNDLYRANDSLYNIAGEEYVEKAFLYARAADPKAQLFYNDYRFSDPIKRKKIYDLLKRLKDKGIPIDGVGMQSHYTPNEVTMEYLQETINMFAGLGLKVQITELDVSVYNYRDKKHPDVDKKDDAYTDERKKQQSNFYKQLFALYLKNKDKINGVTFWGATDLKKNFRTNRIGKMDYPFLFNQDLTAKPFLTDLIALTKKND